ncbi:hypothetical protein LTR17_012595 [Elasticomyces elasticus]|nr:hypothetical protein LTR17_012595 [Elasticomyces elasticus]
MDLSSADDDMERPIKRQRTDSNDDEADADADESLFVPEEKKMSLLPYRDAMNRYDDDSEDEYEEDEINSCASDDEGLDAADPKQKYAESDEAYPECAIYDSDIAAITEMLTDIPAKVKEVLDSQDCDAKHVKSHLNAASALASIPITKRLKVALIGNSGVGKSSFLNNLCDIPELAKAVGGGESVTCVPTLYVAPFEGQSKRFAAIIHYYDMKDIRKLLAEAIDHYSLWEFEADDSWDPDDQPMYEKRAATAMTTFLMLFDQLDMFRTEDAAKEYLRSNHKASSSGALDIMVEACQAKLKAKTIHDGAYHEVYQANTIGKLRAFIDPMTGSNSGSDEPALWPLVKEVSIGVKSSRVLDQMTIIDMPGMSDVNETRIKKTREFIQTCDFIIFIAGINRIIDDGVCSSIVQRYGRLFGGRILVIATHSDTDADQKLAKHLKDKRRDVQAYYDFSNQKKELAGRIVQLNREIDHAKTNPRKYTKLDTQRKYEEVGQLKKQRDSVDVRRFEFLVEARNQHVTEQLRASLRKFLPEGAVVPVHCISNLHYEAIKTGRSVNGPRLGPEATGIPTLRAYALELAASGLFRTLEQYGRHSLNVFMKDAQLWAKTTPVQRRADVLDVARLPLKRLEHSTSKRLEAFELAMEKHLIHILEDQFDATRATAQQVLNQKSRKPPATILSFLRKNGNHSTKTCTKECWNEDFMKGVTDIIDGNWEAFENNRIRITDLFRDGLIKSLRDIVPDIKRKHPLSSEALPLEDLNELIEAQIGLLKEHFSNDVYPYSQETRSIRMNVTHDSHINYFSRTMVATYAECANDRGPGVTARCIDRLRNHLLKPQVQSPFTAVSRSLSSALLRNDVKHLQQSEDGVGKRAEGIFREVFGSFDRLVTQTVESPEEKKARESLQPVLKGLDEVYQEAIQMLNEVKERYET